MKRPEASKRTISGNLIWGSFVKSANIEYVWNYLSTYALIALIALMIDKQVSSADHVLVSIVYGDATRYRLFTSGLSGVSRFWTRSGRPQAGVVFPFSSLMLHTRTVSTPTRNKRKNKGRSGKEKNRERATICEEWEERNRVVYVSFRL